MSQTTVLRFYVFFLDVQRLRQTRVGCSQLANVIAARDPGVSRTRCLERMGHKVRQFVVDIEIRGNPNHGAFVGDEEIRLKSRNKYALAWWACLCVTFVFGLLLDCCWNYFVIWKRPTFFFWLWL